MAWTFYNASGEALTSFGPVALTDLDIDGGTAIGEAVVGADLFIADNGAGGTNVKVTATEIATFIGTDTDTRSGSAKAWSMINAWPGTSSNFVIIDSYNIDSITDNGPGLFTHTWTTDFAVANTYVNGGWSSEGRVVAVIYDGAAVGSSQLTCTIGGGDRTDGVPVMVVAFGDQ